MVSPAPPAVCRNLRRVGRNKPLICSRGTRCWPVSTAKARLAQHISICLYIGYADRHLPCPRRPHPPRRVRTPGGAGGQRGRDERHGSAGGLRRLPAGDLPASGGAEGCRAGGRAAPGPSRLLPGGAPGAGPARRLGRPLPRLLARANREAEGSLEGDGMMNAETPNRSEPKEPDSILFECELDAPPEKVWRALTEPALLARWLLPVQDPQPESGGRLAFAGEAEGLARR